MESIEEEMKSIHAVYYAKKQINNCFFKRETTNIGIEQYIILEK